MTTSNTASNNASTSTLNNGENNMNPLFNNIDFTSFFSTTDTLPEQVSANLSKLRADLAEEAGKEIADRAEKVMSVIALHHMVTQVGGKDSVIGSLLFNLLVENTSFWPAKIKNEDITYGKQYLNALQRVTGNNDKVNAMFQEVVEATRNLRLNKLQDGKTQLISFDYKTKEEVLLKEFDKSVVRLSLMRTGVKILVNKNTVITPVFGQEFLFTKKTSMVVGTEVLNKDLETVLKSLRIHNQTTRIKEKDLYQLEVKGYTLKPYRFNKADALVILLLLKENNIVLDNLFSAAQDGVEKLLVLSRKEKTKEVKSLERIIAPAHTFPEKYSLSGVASLTDTKQGYLVPMVSIPRLVEFTKDSEDFDIVITRQNVNNAISRFDKLNNATGLWNQTIRLFIVSDATQHPEVNTALVGGDLLVPDQFILSNGVCRVVTDMDNGGIKSSTAPYSKLDKELAKGDLCMISSAGYKGGLLAAIGQMAGNTSIIGNLKKVIEGYDEADLIVQQITQAVMSNLTTIQVAGKPVSGVIVEVEVKITNAYTLDSVKASSKEEVLTSKEKQEQLRLQIEEQLEQFENDTGKQSTGIRAIVAQEKGHNPDFSLIQWIKKGLENGDLVKKPLVTRVIAQELQSVAHWYGKSTAVCWLKDLLATQEEHGFDVDKLYAIQLLGAVEKEIHKVVQVEQIVEILNSSTFSIQKESPTYTKATMEKLINLFGDSAFGWVTLVYPNGKEVAVPTGTILMGDVATQMKNDKKYVVAKGLLNDVLENIKGLVKEDGTLFEASDRHLFLKALVQKPLLGKNLGYQYAKGYYGVALPMLGNYGVSTAGITNRDRMVRSDLTWVGMTLSKAPQYFKGMTATYNVIDLDFGHDMNLALECAVFVNVEIVLMHQNDFDGDMYRITVGDSLPMVEKIYEEFNGKFFKDSYEAEMDGNILSMKKAQQCYLHEYHEAVYNAILAKDHIGSYTANSYYYEAMLPNLINKSFIDTNGNSIEVITYDAYVITALLKMLIQVEAMDNVKQVGSSTFITEMLMHYKLRNIKGYNGTTDEQAIANHLNKLEEVLNTLAKAYEMTLSTKEVERLVQISYHTAVTFNTKESTALNLFNARNINEKAINNLNTYMSTGEYDSMYDFENSYEAILNGADQESMYYEIIIQTVESLCSPTTLVRL